MPPGALQITESSSQLALQLASLLPLGHRSEVSYLLWRRLAASGTGKHLYWLKQQQLDVSSNHS
jgi:hypothetical protein